MGPTDEFYFDDIALLGLNQTRLGRWVDGWEDGWVGVGVVGWLGGWTSWE